ncbi:MAG: T9SS type A sorting domain-containing protein [Bacteroidota bacterium]|nr:T9SS type A sorting domain-containing protein [Bacteroidota bacterium]
MCKIGAIILLCLPVFTYAQSYWPSMPLSWSKDAGDISPLIIETPDVTEWDKKLNKTYYDVLDQDSIAAQSYPHFIAIDHKIEISQAQGYSFVTENNEFVWVCRVRFPGLEKLQLLSDNFYIPDSAKLFIYSAQRERLLLTIGSNANNAGGLFNTGPLSDSDIVIEYNEKLSADGKVKGRFGFDRISLFFMNAADAGASLPCNNDVNCNPWHDDLCQEIRSAVKLMVGVTVVEGPALGAQGWWSCSGGLVNNSNSDLRPLILSARHCVTDSRDGDNNLWVAAQPDTWVVHYNFQSPVCTPITMGNDEMTTVGLNELGRDWCSDMLILEVTENAGLFPQIPIQYNYYMNAWHTLSLLFGTDIFGVHHPQGDLKKVSQGLLGGVHSPVPCHWRVTFTNGTVQRGSSGSPLLDAPQWTVGTLSFGITTEDDCDLIWFYYGQLSTSGRDVLRPLDNDEDNLTAHTAIDPIRACLDHIDIFGELYPGASWLAAQNQITIQAANTISVAPMARRTVIFDFPPTNPPVGRPVQPSPGVSSDYVFLAGQSITFFPGFSINNPVWGGGTTNVMSAQIGPCLPWDGCGFNYSKKEPDMTHTDSILNSDSIIRVPTKYGGMKYYRKTESAERPVERNIINANELKLYANPTPGGLSVEYTEAFTYTLTDMIGRLVLTGEKRGGDDLVLDISSIVPGIYYIRVISGEHQQVQAVVKE